MALHTRRAFLGLGTGALSLVSGCADSDPRDDRPPDPVPDEDDVFTDLEVRRFRFDTTTEVVEWDADPRPYVTSDADVAEIAFRIEPIGADSGDDPVAFLRGIDFDEATGLLLEFRTGACYKQAVQYVARRDGGGLEARFCETMRDPSVACSVDETQTQVTLIEVPVAFEDEPNSVSYGSGSGCRLPPDHPASDGGDRE